MATGLSLGQAYESEHGTVVYDTFGEGDPLILIHGAPSSSNIWRDVSS